MVHVNGIHGKLRTGVGVLVTTWSNEDGAEYAQQLMNIFPEAVPADNIEVVMSPMLLESEQDIPRIDRYFSDHGIEALLMIPGNFTLDHVMPFMSQSVGPPTVLWGLTTQEAW
jgi:hypothetical protein